MLSNRAGLSTTETPAAGSEVHVPMRVDRRQIAALALGIFALLSAAYLLTYSGMFHSGDEIGYVRSAIDLAQGVTQDAGHGGIFTLVLALVFRLTHGIAGIGPLQAMFLLNWPVTALTAVGLFLLAEELGYDKRAGILLAIIYGLSTPAWVYSKMLFREPWGALGLIGAMWFAVRFVRRLAPADLILAIVSLALGVGSRVSVAVAAPFLAVYMGWAILESERSKALRSRHRYLLATGGVALVLTVVIALALLVTKYRFALSNLVSFPFDLRPFVGLLVSPGRGLLIYAPVMLPALAGVPLLARRHPREAFVLCGSALVYFLMSGIHPMWWGGWNWGPRFLVAFLPFMIFPLIAVLERIVTRRRDRWLAVPLVLLTLAGVIVQVFGVTFGPRMATFGGILQTAEAFDWRLAPVTWNWATLEPLGLDIAWLNLSGGRASSVFIVAPLLALLVMGARALARYVRATPRLRTVAVMIALVLIGTAAIMGWSLKQYYALDNRYGAPAGYGAAIERVLTDSRPGDTLIADYWSSTDIHILPTRLYNYCRGACPPFQLVARETLRTTDRTSAWLQDVPANFERVWLLPIDGVNGDPNSVVEYALDQRSYKEGCTWVGANTRLCLYHNPIDGPLGSVTSPGTVAFGDVLALQKGVIRARAGGAGDSTGQLSARAGQPLFIDLEWWALKTIDRPYKVSFQLLDGAGGMQVQVDREPLDGFRPTGSWQADETIRDRLAFMLPGALSAGTYRLYLVVYDPNDGVRLNTVEGDALMLAEVQVTPAQTP